MTKADFCTGIKGLDNNAFLFLCELLVQYLQFSQCLLISFKLLLWGHKELHRKIHVHEAISCHFPSFFSPLQQTCAVCLEEFRSRDELGVCPCSHAFHKK